MTTLFDLSFDTNIANKDEYFLQYTNITGAASFVQVREGCDFAAKEKDVDAFFQTFWKGYHPILTRLDKLYFSSLDTFILQNGNFTLVKILFAVGVVILLFSIMNYINLTVAQSGYRAREMATRRPPLRLLQKLRRHQHVHGVVGDVRHIAGRRHSTCLRFRPIRKPTS